MNLAFTVGGDLGLGQVVALAFVPAFSFVAYVLWSDRARPSDPPDTED